MKDEHGGDEKIVAVPVSRLTHRYENVKNYTDMQEMTWRRIEHFFVHYKDLEPGKWSEVAGWGDSEEARRMISEAIERAKQKK
jgi:inorganic pyrophosphatase